jgi:hypothetical protein
MKPIILVTSNFFSFSDMWYVIIQCELQKLLPYLKLLVFFSYILIYKIDTVNSRLSGGGLTGLRLNRGFFFKFICYLIFIHFCFTW